jgi:hypothetical protein
MLVRPGSIECNEGGLMELQIEMLRAMAGQVFARERVQRGPQQPRSTIANVERVDDQTMSADTQLFFSNGWSRSFVHGADMMMPLGNLVEEQLLAGNKDTIAGIQRLRFRKLATNNMRLTASRNPLPRENRSACTLEAELTTHNSGPIYVQGIQQPENPIFAISAKNPLPASSICGCPNCTAVRPESGEVTMQLRATPLHETLLHAHNGLLTCTIMDQVNLAMSQLRGTGKLTGNMAMHMGNNALTLPSKEFLLQQGNTLRVKVDLDRARTLQRTGATLVTAQATYTDAKGAEQGGGEFLFAFGDVSPEQLLDTK